MRSLPRLSLSPSASATFPSEESELPLHTRSVTMSISRQSKRLSSPPLSFEQYSRCASTPELPEISVPNSQLKPKFLKAIRDGEYSMVWALLGKGADPNEIDDSNRGGAPLHMAAKEGNLAICQLLVSRGADVNFRDRSGQTALHKVAYWGRLQIAEFLIYVGGSIKIADNMNQTPVEIAFHRNNQEVYNLFTHVKSSKKTSNSSWNVKKQFEELLKDQAKEDKLLKRNQKLEEKMSKITKDISRIKMIKDELSKNQKTLRKSDLQKLEKNESKLIKLKEEHRENTISISVSRAESFERFALENKAQTWMSFLQEL